MNKYQGVEPNNPILEFIRDQGLELPSLRNAYQLWKAAERGSASFLSSGEAQKWFGHSLFTSNVKVYMARRSLSDISHLYSPNPKRPVFLGPQDATYQPPDTPYSDPELQIERYSSFSAFLWHLVGALDAMTVGLAFLYDFEKIRTTYVLSVKRIEPLRIYFSTSISLLREMDREVLPLSQPSLLDVFRNEGLLCEIDKKTGCQWYETLKDQRNYYTHVAFPILYMEDGEWRIPVDARSAAPTSNLTDPVPVFCWDLFENAHRFIGSVYDAAWADFSPFLWCSPLK